MSYDIFSGITCIVSIIILGFLWFNEAMPLFTAIVVFAILFAIFNIFDNQLRILWATFGGKLNTNNIDLCDSCQKLRIGELTAYQLVHYGKFEGLDEVKAVIYSLHKKVCMSCHKNAKEFLYSYVKKHNLSFNVEEFYKLMNGKSEGTKPALAKPKPPKVKQPTNQSPIGKWKRYSNGFDYYFNFDSSGTFDTDELPGRDVTNGKYEVKGNTIILTVPSSHNSSNVDVAMFNYTVSGNSLTLYLPNGEQNHYEKI